VSTYITHVQHQDYFRAMGTPQSPNELVIIRHYWISALLLIHNILAIAKKSQARKYTTKSRQPLNKPTALKMELALCIAGGKYCKSTKIGF